MSKGGKSQYKGFARNEFAQPSSSIKPHSRQSGDRRRLLILRALSKVNYPLSVREIVEKTGLPRRTVHYYLSQLLSEGLVVRIGKKPLSAYELTNRGRKLVVSSYLSVQTRNRRRKGVVRERRGGVSRVTVSVSRVDNELRFRARWSEFRRVIRGAIGRDVTSLQYHHFYTKNGVLHYDSRHPFYVEDAYGDLLGIVGNFVITASFLKGLVDEDVVYRLVEAAPVADFHVVEQAEILQWW